MRLKVLMGGILFAIVALPLSPFLLVLGFWVFLLGLPLWWGLLLVSWCKTQVRKVRYNRSVLR